MKREPGIQWLFMDINSFFTSVEQQENPELRNRPIAVIPMDTDYTCVIAASYEAKKYGVKTGVMVKQAKIMCPEIRFVTARHDLYVAYHNRIIEEVVKHTPINKVCSIDELSSRLPPRKRSITAAYKIAKNIKNGIRDNIGAYINCSIGCAPNSFLAKIACDIRKPNGLTFLPQETLPHSLFTLGLSDITGIGTNMEKRLNRLRIASIQDFVQLSPKKAKEVWGSIIGEHLWYLMRGSPQEQNATSISVIGHSRILPPQTRTLRSAKIILRTLTIKASHRLRHKGLYTGLISISLRAPCGKKSSHKIKVVATNDILIILNFLDSLWDKAILDIANPFPPYSTKIKKVSAQLSELKTTHETTEDLFTHTYAHSQTNASLPLCEALDSLQKKYKKQIVTVGPPPKTATGHVGTKIAFSRIPEQQEFFV